MKRSCGFTIIELLIVIAIIGILISIALPSYKHYTDRARFSEVMMATAPYKTAVSLSLQEGVSVDALNSGENGVPASPPPSKNLENIMVANGVITSTASESAGGYTYVLTPDASGSHWTVSGTCVDAGLCKA